MKGGVIMISFYNWVIPLKDLKTPFGDFANDVHFDANFPKKATSKDSILKYLNSLNASLDVLELFDLIYFAYSLDMGKISYQSIKNIKF